MKTLHEQIANKCIHFNGIMNDCCKAGVNYADVRVGKPYLFPCIKTGGECVKAQFRNEDEIKKYIEEIEIGSAWAISTMLKVREEVRKGEHGFGSIDCDCGGTISFSVARINGHIRAGCNKCKQSIME